MSNLDNLTSRIIDDAEVRKNEILKEANTKAQEIIDSQRERANEKSSSILRKAEKEGQQNLERIISKAQLELRNEKLRTKQLIIDKAFNMAVEKLEAMEPQDFEAFMKRILLNLEIAGDEEVIICESYKDKLSKSFLEEVNKALVDSNKEGKLRFCKQEQLLESGFKLRKNGVEINYTFKELVNSLRYEMEYFVGNILFAE